MKAFVLSIFILLILSCSLPDKFGVPSWNTSYKLKMLNDTWHVSELATEDSTLVMEEDILQFHTSIIDQATMGNFNIEHPGEKNTHLVLGEIHPELNEIDGEEVPEIQPFELFPVTKQFDEFEEYQEVTFSQGHFLLTIENNTSVFLGNQPENPLQANLLNYSNNEIFIAQNYPQNIPPNSSSTMIVPLAGITIPNTIEVEISGGSKGSDGEAVLVDINEAITIHLEFSNIKASHAVARIPNQEINSVSDSQIVDTNYPHIAGEFQLAGTSAMELDWTSPIPVRSVLIIEAMGNETVELQMNDGSYPIIDYVPGDEPIVFQNDECNLNEFLSVLPTRFEYTMLPTIGDDSGEYYEIWHDDEVRMQIHFIADINLEADCWIIPQSNGNPKTSKVETEDFNNDMYDAFIRGGFLLEYINNTGSEVSFDVLISTQDFLTFDEVLQPDLENVRKLHIPRMELNEGNTFQQMEIVLEHDDLLPLLADSVFVASRLQFISSAEHPLQNGIDLKGEIFLELLMNHELIENN